LPDDQQAKIRRIIQIIIVAHFHALGNKDKINQIGPIIEILEPGAKFEANSWPISERGSKLPQKLESLVSRFIEKLQIKA